ncbi:GntR family transcriptional regulator [Vibrio albus]|uniref:GntR family transcriptional regulator n=1 Tax=Vibrio albus TaxID=2200953 RepID=A0A2U3BAC5_9VIBR|nr:GntR family transcriptional regulator [Vibrio albus]PWI33750.1 GntR family transcriptional regulator [Vibrio albus]
MIYLSIANQLRSRINSDEFQLNQALPSENQLAKEYGVARMTIRKAMDTLIQEGMLDRRHGSGCYIIDKEMTFENTGLNSLTEQIGKTTKTLTSKVISFSVIPCPSSVAQRLKISPGESIYYIIRIRSVDTHPVHYEESFLPVSLYPTLSVAHMEHSKFQYIEDEMGLVIEGNYFTFKPYLMPESIALHMEMTPGELAMQVSSISHAPDGRVLDYSITVENTHFHQSTYYYRRPSKK